MCACVYVRVRERVRVRGVCVMQMPESDGYEAARLIRAASPEQVMMGLTGNTLEDQRREFERHGVSLVLSKPLDVRKFRAIVAEYGLDE